MMKALIDADRIAYAFGGFKDDEGFPVEWPLLQSRIEDNINNILLQTKATSYQLYLTSDDKSNFRFDVATILPYKGHRSTDKPFWYEQIRRYLVHEWKAEIVFGMEADDALGIEQCAKNWYMGLEQEYRTIICSVDKDLDTIPGLHFNELHPEKGVYEISEIDAQRNFFNQLLCGDRTDNIPGLFGVGKSSALLRNLESLVHWDDMYLAVKEQYEKRFGSYWKLFMYENAQLLWILRSYDPEEILKRFEATEERIQERKKTESEVA